jgi:hypothetical protein
MTYELRINFQQQTMLKHLLWAEYTGVAYRRGVKNYDDLNNLLKLVYPSATVIDQSRSPLRWYYNISFTNFDEYIEFKLRHLD